MTLFYGNPYILSFVLIYPVPGRIDLHIWTKYLSEYENYETHIVYFVLIHPIKFWWKHLNIRLIFLKYVLMHHRLMKKGNNSLILSVRISGVTLVLVSDIFPIFVSIGLGKNNFENTLEGHTNFTPQSWTLEKTPYSCYLPFTKYSIQNPFLISRISRLF